MFQGRIRSEMKRGAFISMRRLWAKEEKEEVDV